MGSLEQSGQRAGLIDVTIGAMLRTPAPPPVGLRLPVVRRRQTPASARSASALSVRSHENSGSSRPKCP